MAQMWCWNDGDNLVNLGLLETYWPSQTSEKREMFLLTETCLLPDFLLTCWGGPRGREISRESDSSACAKWCLVYKEWWTRDGVLCQWHLPCCVLLFTLLWKENNCFNSHLIKILLVFGDSIKLQAFLLIAKFSLIFSCNLLLQLFTKR